jgi:hypothetical protein
VEFLHLAPSALTILVLWRLKQIEAKQDRDAGRIHTLESLVTGIAVHAGLDVKPFTGGR